MGIPAAENLRAIVFDYGNTLIEFARYQIDHCDGALADAVRGLFGDFDVERFDAIREEGRMAPYRSGFRENQLPQLTRDAIERLFSKRATGPQIDELVEVRFRAFVECIQAESSTDEVLGELARYYRLGVLSNYPCGRSIRASLAATGLDRHLSAVAVSGEIGFVKPHPKAYETILTALEVEPEDALFVGDNWLADVQGSKRAGMHCVHMRRWVPPEHFEPELGDHDPDATIEHLTELATLLKRARDARR